MAACGRDYLIRLQLSLGVMTQLPTRMIELLSESTIIGRGELGLVFDAGNQRALKVYRAADAVRSDSTLATLHREELRAYELAAADSILARHTPHCYGQWGVARIVDDTDQDVSSHYALALTVALDLLTDTKGEYIELVGTRPHLKELFDRFAAHGICAWDASGFAPDSQDSCKFIDITTRGAPDPGPAGPASRPYGTTIAVEGNVGVILVPSTRTSGQ